ncbi:TetR/AcrR family transcriptional regulator [Mycobacterium sp. NPDC050853]|uniref:TetR/AcrR family transcriptional regulator n=1 Tax=Mycobacteriaceae TaxID=1762 RepID=UPI0015DF45BE|nr:TetR/AcrR family transcriptional regulator [Mycobacteroides sp. LB1]
MARYDAEHKADTRRRIIETASGRFKQDGIDGSGIATLMSDAGLTNGAFYAHFESKNDLVAKVIADQLGGQRAVLASLPRGQAAVEEFVREYLAPHHRDNPGMGCPSAALLDEIGRCDDAIRDSYTAGIQSVVDVIATHLSSYDPPAARTRALGLITVLVATLQLARAVSDRKLSDEVLDAGIRNAQIILNGEQSLQ